jgi:transcriptional regulator with XRE-family HTH domain
MYAYTYRVKREALWGLSDAYVNAYISRMTPITLRVKELREARKWSQAELARRAKVRRAMLSELEAGKRQRIDLAILERLASALEVDPALLLVRTPPAKPRRPRR